MILGGCRRPRPSIDEIPRGVGGPTPRDASIHEQFGSSSVRLSEAEPLYRQGIDSEAEPLFRQTLTTQREVLGDQHPDTLRSMNNLAELLRNQGKLSEAEPSTAKH